MISLVLLGLVLSIYLFVWLVGLLVSYLPKPLEKRPQYNSGSSECWRMPVCNLRIEKELVSICNLGFRLFSLGGFYFTAVWHIKLGKRGYSNAVSFSLAIVGFFFPA